MSEERTNLDIPQERSTTDRNERESPRHDRDERRRSRSPRRDKPRRKDAGFKWKEKRRDDEDRRDVQDDRLHRGYKDHYKPRPRSRSRSPHADRRRERASNTVAEPTPPKSEEKEVKEKKKEKRSTPVAPSEPMMIVYVNDRLGTKKAVPCLPSDTIKDFKTIVASMIGRRPHEILLKRQSERPFKDQLTLQDYGVSNNVQLDLEVDTGD